MHGPGTLTASPAWLAGDYSAASRREHHQGARSKPGQPGFKGHALEQMTDAHP